MEIGLAAEGGPTKKEVSRHSLYIIIYKIACS